MHWTFWLFAALLILIALIWPLRILRQRQYERHRTEQINLAIYRERLDELKQDLQNGTLEQSQFDEAKEELATSLLNDLKTDEPKQDSARRLGRYHWPAMAGIAIVVPLLALLMFDYLNARIHFVATSPSADSAESRQAEGESRQLLAQIKQKPGEAELWAELGARYMQMQRPYEAQQAYRRALQLGFENPDVLIRLAHAIGQTQNGDLSGAPAKHIQRALSLDPDHRPSLIWAGLLSFQKGDFEAALRYWKKVRQALSAQAPQHRMLDRLIAQANQRLSGDAPQGPTADSRSEEQQTSTTGQPVSIEVAVALSPNLKDKVKPDQTLFILARAANGPPMPLAVVRRQAGDLPLELTLDDSQAMTSRARLSSFDKVVIVARISLTGRPIAQPGDMFGQTDPLTVADAERVQVTIDQIVSEEE